MISALGGFEIAMMAGFLLGAASCRLPVVLDGYISGAAFLIARALSTAISRATSFSPTNLPSMATLVCSAPFALSRCSISKCAWAKALGPPWP